VVPSAATSRITTSVPSAATQVLDPVFTIHIGDPYSKLVALYGEVEHQKNGYRSWKRKEFELKVVVDKDSIIRHLWVSIKPDSVLCTQDGLCLGKDTFESFALKVNRIGMKFDESMATGEGHTILVEGRINSLPNNGEERVEYTWGIDEGEIIDGKPFEISEEQLNNQLFAHVPITSYSLSSTDPKYKDRPEAPGEENTDCCE